MRSAPWIPILLVLAFGTGLLVGRTTAPEALRAQAPALSTGADELDEALAGEPLLRAGSARRPPSGADGDVDRTGGAGEAGRAVALDRDVRARAQHALFERLEELVASGRPGCLEALRVLQGSDLPWLFSPSEVDAPLLAAWTRFALEHPALVLRLFETATDTSAHGEGEDLEAANPDALEVLIRLLGSTLPAVATEEELAVVRRNAQEAVRRIKPGVYEARGILDHMLAGWAAGVSAEGARRRLDAGQFGGPYEGMVLLSRLEPGTLDPEQVANIFSLAISEPGGDTEATVFGLDRVDLPPASWPDIDEAWRVRLAARPHMEVTLKTFQGYMRRTRRGGWPAAAPYLDGALRQGGAAASNAAWILARLRPGAPAEVVESWLEGSDLPEASRRELEALLR